MCSRAASSVADSATSAKPTNSGFDELDAKPTTSRMIPASVHSSPSGKLPHGAGGRSAEGARRRNAAGARGGGAGAGGAGRLREVPPGGGRALGGGRAAAKGGGRGARGGGRGCVGGLGQGTSEGALAASTTHVLRRIRRGGPNPATSNGQPEESLTSHQPISMPT